MNQINTNIDNIIIDEIKVRQPKVKKTIPSQIAYNKKYLVLNYDKIRAKHLCNICNNTYTYSHKSEHYKTKKHQQRVDLIKLEQYKNKLLKEESLVN